MSKPKRNRPSPTGRTPAGPTGGPTGGLSLPSVTPPSPPTQGPAEVLVRLSGGVSDPRLVLTLPSGRESTLPAVPESMWALVQLLETLARPAHEARLKAQAKAQAQALWPKGLQVEFWPPEGSEWKKVPWWPKQQWPMPLTSPPAFAPALYMVLTVEAERAKSQEVLCKVQDVGSFLIPSKWLRPVGVPYHGPRKPKAKSPISLSARLSAEALLAELGF